MFLEWTWLTVVLVGLVLLTVVLALTAWPLAIVSGVATLAAVLGASERG